MPTLGLIIPTILPVLGFSLLLVQGAAQQKSASLAPDNPPPGLSPGAISLSEGEFERLKKQAENARNSNQIPEAVRLYQQILGWEPEWAEGWWYLGTLHYEADRYTRAESAFRRVTSLEPSSGPAWAMLGLCEFRTQQYAAALDHLVKGRALGIGGNEDLARVVRYHQAVLFTLGRQFEAALELLNGFAVEHRESETVLDALGMAVLRIPAPIEKLSGEQKEMVRQFGKVAFLTGERRMAESRKMYAELEARFRSLPNVSYAYAVFLLADKEPDQAISFFKNELERDPNHVAALLQVALSAVDSGKFEEGFPYASRAVAADPENFAGYYTLGRIYVELNELSKAIEMLEKAAKIAPEVPTVHFVLSRAYARAKRPADAARARAEFSRLEQLDKKRRGEATGER